MWGLDMGAFDLSSEVVDVIFQIRQYKWIQSEKSGYDIGLSRATREWVSNYYDEWFRHNRSRFVKHD